MVCQFNYWKTAAFTLSRSSVEVLTGPSALCAILYIVVYAWTIKTMLHIVGVFVFVLGSVKCAMRLLDPPSINFDSHWSPSFTSFESLDPRNQAVSSSYSIIHTSSGSSGPSQVSYSKTEFKPEGQYSEHKAKHERRLRPEFEDDSSSREYTFDTYPDTRYEITTRKPLTRLYSKTNRYRKLPSEGSSTSPPRSINEIVEKVAPLEEAGSAKSGKYLGSGGLDDSYEEGYDREKHYGKEGGKKFIEAHKSEEGEKAHKNYKKAEGYDHAEKEHHDKEQKKKALSEKEGLKKAHLDEEKHHGEEYKGHKGEKGIKANSKGEHERKHTKSSSTKKHNKNEYKLDEEFYEHSHEGDEHEEHLDEHQKRAKELAGEAKKHHLDSGYHEGHSDKSAKAHKGLHHEEEAGHHKEGAEREHHDEHSQYGKKGSVKEGGKYGHAEGGGHGGGYSDHGGF